MAAAALLVLVGPYLIPLPAQPDLDPAELAPPAGRFITVAGTRTFIEEAGPADGPAVVLVHGFGGLTYSWRNTLPALGAAGYRALALDLRGFGLSDKRLADDFSHPAQADFVAEVMSAAGIERAVLVGHSMGGSVIAHLAQRHPERVRALVFVDAAVREAGSGQAAGRSVLGFPNWLGTLADFPPLQRWARLAVRYSATRERVTGVLRSAYYRPDAVTDPVIEGYLKVQKIRDWDLALLGVLRDSGKNALPRPAASLGAPAIVIWGQHDPWIPLASGQALHAALPGAQWAVIADSGHLPMEEAPQAFNDALLAFLGAVGP